MLTDLRELYGLLTHHQRRQLLRLQVLVVAMALCELLSVASIAPFMAVVGDLERLGGDGVMGELYRASGADSPERFLLWLGLGVLGALSVAAVVSMVTVWRLAVYGATVGAELGSRLFAHYMHKDWLFHAGGSSSYLTKQIAQECQRVMLGVIDPLMQMNAKVVLALFMSLAILIYNPAVALCAMALFSLAYLLLYHTARRRLMSNGEALSAAQGQRFRLMAEGFGGIKDLLLLGRQTQLTERFDRASRRFARAQGTNQALKQAPRYAMEVVAFASVILLLFYLLKTHQGEMASMLPVLAVYALAGFKLLPAFQHIYASVSSIRGNLHALEEIRNDLRASHALDQACVLEHGGDPAQGGSPLKARREIRLEGVSFRYPGARSPAVDDVSLVIPANSVIGLVGASGSGKSTLIDLLLGLMQPQRGRISVDGKVIDEANRRQWQDALGFVSQQLYLCDGSIRDNVAFGLAPECIDDDRVERALRLAHLAEFVAELPQGIETLVGERGVQLSGGQRQRIGIARALYHEAEVLVLDEATSALDGITERLIMDAIHDFAGRKSIVLVAHRLTTVMACECIYMMERGRLVDQGSYRELMSRNEVFKRMAQSA